ncbi:hypothetical protein EDD21DRAFT_362095 [Dissophora ornata]|nr:hypothetical protein EDD21DRAFT_362095 [Dissophora ornata]
MPTFITHSSLRLSEGQDCFGRPTDPDSTCTHASNLDSSESLPTPSHSPSLSPPLSPVASCFSESSSCSSSITPADDVDDEQQREEPFSLLTHPAVVYASARLSDPDYTSRLRTVKVFDFDQTLFQSPLPNPALWDPSFVGILTAWNYCGTGWWHNPGTLELGPELEAKCWEGWWNEEIVKKVQESSEDPGCLTVLLTGRNGPTFGYKLIEMAERKGLDFDIIATKPTTVARIESNVPFTPTCKMPKPVDRYLKVHTFNTKHDFLYNLLFEYPNIRKMHLWDDRPCQVAKFRQVGQEWLDRGMLDDFEITVVQEPLLYMDPQREAHLVLAMVEANNKQVDIEAAGGLFLVPGVGPFPRTRPELKDLRMWDPYEIYIPQARLKVEVTKIVRYTGILFSEVVQKIMREKLGRQNATSSEDQWIEQPQELRGEDLSKWVVPDDLHVTICLGPAPEEHLKMIGGLGATALVEVESLGQHEGQIWALKIKEMDLSNVQDQRELQIVAPNGDIYSSIEALRSAYASLQPSSSPSSLSNQYTHVDLDHLGHVVLKRDVTPHITMAYDRLNGVRAVDSAKIKGWGSLMTPMGAPFYKRLIFVGTIGEKRLLGMKCRKPPGQLSASAKGGISVANVIKSLTGDKDISGRELGEMINSVKEEMERMSVENGIENEERIATIAQEVCDRAQTRKSASSSRHHSPTIV